MIQVNCACRLFLLLLVFFNYPAAHSQTAWSVADELKHLSDIYLLPQYRTGTIPQQVSSYDTTGMNDDGFSGKYSFVRRNADSSLVMVDITGPGVINRIWTPTPTNDTLDFYIDDTTRPAFSVRYIDLFSGDYFPFIKPLTGNELGGYFTYVPIPFQKHFRIVSRGRKLMFHQVQYRLLPGKTNIKSFKRTFDAQEKDALDKVARTWSELPGSPASYVNKPADILIKNFAISLQPGQSKQVFLLPTGGRITGLQMFDAHSLEGLEKNIDIRVWWDDEKQPAIECPAADFFGYAFGKVSMKSVLAGTKGDTNYCYLPMPFDRKARIELIYRKSSSSKNSPVSLSGRVFYTNQQRSPETEGRLYARWSTETLTENRPHLLLEASGKGHVAGTILQAQGLNYGITSFFEGDDSTVIDGKLQLHGTGSEDYFNGGWYAMLDRWDSRMSLPVHGSLDYSLPYSRTGGYRFFLGDKMSFGESIYHSIEHGPEHNNAPGIYTSVCFYYADRPPVSQAKPENSNTVVYIPDTLVVFPVLSNFAIQDQVTVITGYHFPTGSASYIFRVTDETKLRISLADIEPGDYQLFVDYAKHNVGCEFSIWQRQTMVSDWMPGYASDRERIPMQYMSDIRLDENLNTITVNFRTSPVRTTFFLNRFILVRKK